MGFSEEGVKKLMQGAGSLSDSIGTGVARYGDSVETGRHALNGLSKADAELFSKWGGRVGWAGNAVQFALAVDNWLDGGAERNQKLGEAVGGIGGSMLGGAGAGAAVGTFGGPLTAAAAAVIGGLLGGFAGSDIGGDIGGLFDPKLAVGSGGGGSW